MSRSRPELLIAFQSDKSPEEYVELARLAERGGFDVVSVYLAAAPLEAWPDTPTSFLCRDDRMFPGAWARRHARERLDIDLDEMDGGHYVALSRLRELAHGLAAYAASTR